MKTAIDDTTSEVGTELAGHRVCRLFRDIILESPHLQYILELDSCGYVEPANPRRDLNYADKLRLIRDTRGRWMNPSSVKPTVIELPVNTARSPTYEYSDGIYVRGLRASGSLKLACLEIPGGRSSSFSFISEDYFVIPRNSGSYDLGTPANNDTLGRLDICCLRSNKQGILSYGDCCLASFMLPTLRRGQGESCLHLRCAPTPTPATCYVQRDPFHRLYDIAPDTQLLCVNIRTSSIINFPFDEPHGTLYVPSRDLLDVMAKHSIHFNTAKSAVRIPWSTWAKYTSWVDTRELKTNNERYMYGQRVAAFSAEMSFPGEGYNAITILDFDKRRVRARLTAGSDSAREVCMPQATDFDEDQEVDDFLPVRDRNCGQSFFEGDEVPKRAYLRTSMGLPSRYMDMFSSTMMDDEHVVVKLSNEEGRMILAYNF
ncbi:hypothetical protein FRC07_006446 [Ceratobasidium sp. 392]|nr:hypothetical protein FRC07_006446 [Ceratobasidium sp. 392]